MSFERLGLRAELLAAVGNKGYEEPTPVQKRAVPVVLAGRDVLARAQTGTGKTDAFALPLVEMLAQGPPVKGRRPPRVLVLVPTRELALQVGECFKDYARRVSLRCTVVYGGVRIEPQIDRLRRGVDILVATPGRLLELSMQRTVDLSGIAYLVFDEADRMLDLGFSREINAILSRIPEKRQTMLFSATYSAEVRSLAAEVLDRPETIEVSPEKTVAEPVIQNVFHVDQVNKKDLLVHLIRQQNWPRVLVFTRTIHGANRLAEKLEKEKIQTAPLHSSKSQNVRIRTLEQFRTGEIRVLVATDVAARGLDITDLPCVINFDMPKNPDDYVHRIGRTGRAGVGGLALSFVAPEERPFLSAVEKQLKQKIPVERVKGYTAGLDVPDFVLYRPGSSSSGKKAGKDLKDLVEKREQRKKGKAPTGTAGDQRGKMAGKPKPASASRPSKPVSGEKKGKHQGRPSGPSAGRGRIKK